MKLSELAGQQTTLSKIQALKDERTSLAELLRDLDDGEGASIETDISYAQTLRPASVPLARQAVEQSLTIVEGELRALGVELDEPALLPDGDDAADDDEAVA